MTIAPIANSARYVMVDISAQGGSGCDSFASLSVERAGSRIDIMVWNNDGDLPGYSCTADAPAYEVRAAFRTIGPVDEVYVNGKKFGEFRP